MPPQQPDRLLDLVDDVLDFRAHGRLVLAPSVRRDLAIAAGKRNGRRGCHAIANR
jgi:hypothetical protein